MQEEKEKPWALYDTVEKKNVSTFSSQKTALHASVGPNNQSKANGEGIRYVVVPNTKRK